MPLDFPANPSDGDQVTVTGVVFTYDSTKAKWIRKQSFSNTTEVKDLLAVDADIVPDTDVTYDLGSNTYRWRDLYVSGSTINLGGTSLSAPNGVLTLPADTEVGGTVISTSTGPEVVATIDDLPGTPEAGDKAFVTGNDTLYLYSGSGWYKIAIVNQSPTITSGGAGEYTLATDGTATVVTLTATDPEGLPLTWSYSVTSGSLGSTATVSQSDNVFTITPSTDTANGGEFELTFTATDNIGNTALDANTFSLQFVSSTWNNVSYKIGTNDTSGIANISYTNKGTASPSFTWRHANSFLEQNSFHPYYEYWSAYFGGQQDMRVDTDCNTALGSGDWTVEYWIKPSDLYNGNGNYVLTRNGGGSFQIGEPTFGHQNGVARMFVFGGTNFSGSISMGEGAWHHIAFVKNSGTISLYVDGVFDTSTSDSTNFSWTGNWTLGQTGATEYKGYLADVRISSNAVYTSAFTPPTEPLSATANTVLLTCQGKTWVDNSGNDFTITPNRVTNTAPDQYVYIVADSPYPNIEYSSGNNYGSIGSGLETSNANRGLWMNSFTSISYQDDWYMDFWYYHPPAYDKYNFMMRKYTYGEFAFLYNNSNGLYLAQNNTTIVYIPAATWYSYAFPGTWNHYHIQYTYDSVTGIEYSLYINGTRRGNYTSASSYNGNISQLGFGQGNSGTSYYFRGYISDFTLNTENKHNHATSITIPTEPKGDTSKAFYLPFDNPGYYDATGKTNLELSQFPVGTSGVTADNTYTKYSATSLKFNSRADGLTLQNFDRFGNDDFCIEGWFYFTDTSQGNVYICGQSESLTGSPSGATRFQLGRKTSGITWWYNGLSAYQDDGTVPLNTGTWYHLAWSKEGNVYRAFVNGAMRINQTGTDYYYQHQDFTLGYSTSNNTGQGFAGYVDDFQITIGIPKYTTAFTAPTSAQSRVYQLTS